VSIKVRKAVAFKLCFQEIVSDLMVIVQFVHLITTILMIVTRMMILAVPVMEMIRIRMLIVNCNGKEASPLF
jgi:hypothetical protein